MVGQQCSGMYRRPPGATSETSDAAQSRSLPAKTKWASQASGTKGNVMAGLDHAHIGIGADGIAAQRASQVRWRIFGIVFVLVVINLIDRVTLSIAMPTISKEFSLEPAMQGLI